MIRQETAETIALHALTWLVGEEELLPQFLAATGAGVSDLKQAAGDPDFLGSVLDYILSDDSIAGAATGALGLPPDGLMQARAALPGAPVPDWT
jgi:Protein of unknown function (DUF3572)